MEKFVTIAIFNYPHEITILKHRLEQEEIQFFFENETMMNIVPMYSQALGGIKLKVHPEDEALAKEIVTEFNGNENLKIV
ncbi:putative signal transducing protein [Flavobacterium qiangtangense]|uniref:Signal transducing protein n=1 Tax=Flavobacterium qiangtangense TaxID=1442595 RepID=A0ABW1PPC6_9FLAO